MQNRLPNKMLGKLIVVAGLVLITVIVVVAVVQGANGSQAISVAQAASGDYIGRRVEVTGQVLDNSSSITGNVVNFVIFDSNDPQTQLSVSYDGALSATFGNQVTAICTGVINSDNVLVCSQLVTKCPSKYENANEALSVSQLLGYGDSVLNVPVKVTGSVQPGSIQPATNDGRRLVLVDTATGQTLDIYYDGGLPDNLSDGSLLVITGTLMQTNNFQATDLAMGE